MTKFQPISYAALAALALAVGGAAVMAPMQAAAATPEEACKEAIASRTGGQVGDPEVSVGTDGTTTVKTLVAGQTYTCVANAAGEVMTVMQTGRGS